MPGRFRIKPAMFQKGRIPLLLLTVVLLACLPSKAEGQCKSFARHLCRPVLENFRHDGNYHAAVLEQGEEAELYKTFFAGQTYRIAVCGTEDLPDIEFSILDNQRNELYNNRTNDYSNTWDFRMEASQQLMVRIKVPPDPPGNKSAAGCVAILFGISGR